MIADSRSALDEGLAAVDGHADIRHAGYLQDAQKEYAEANLTLALVTGTDLPGPTDLEVEDAPISEGCPMRSGKGGAGSSISSAPATWNGRRQLLGAMEEMYGVLVTMDYPDAITMNLRRATDVSRSLIEKTRGDLSISVVQKDLRDALDRHAEELRGKHVTGIGSPETALLRCPTSRGV